MRCGAILSLATQTVVTEEGKPLVLEKSLLIQPNTVLSSIQNTGTVPILKSFPEEINM